MIWYAVVDRDRRERRRQTRLRCERLLPSAVRVTGLTAVQSNKPENPRCTSEDDADVIAIAFFFDVDSGSSDQRIRCEVQSMRQREQGVQMR